MDLIEEQENTVAVETPPSQELPLKKVSYKTGGIARNDAVAPEWQTNDPRFIPTNEYYEKYYHLLPDSWSFRNLKFPCEKWHETSNLPEAKRPGFISEKRLVEDVGMRKKDGTLLKYRFRKRWQWFIFDIPPDEHPGWLAYKAMVIKSLKKSGKYLADQFDSVAPIFLDRFDQARSSLDYTNFKTAELAKIFQTTTLVIRSWTEIGVKGYGKLPHIKVDKSAKPVVLEDGTYYCQQDSAGRLDYYYATKDIRRFLKGELKDPTKKFKTIDDGVQRTNAGDIAQESGYYVYNQKDCYPLTFDGFMLWAKRNIVFYDKVTHRLLPFTPSPKQIEFYRGAFTLNPDGTIKHQFIFTSRPRGDYKTFDLAVIVVFRLVNLPYERIYLVTNSEKQTTHLVFSDVCTIIKNSPTLNAMTNTKGPALDIQSDAIYLRAGKGAENIFGRIVITSAEGGARSNATCIAWSECQEHHGKEEDASEVMDSIRGDKNSMFLAESVVAPRGHWFRRHYEVALEGDEPALFFQYYSGKDRQNPNITPEFLSLKKKTMPLQWKKYFGNEWDDAETSLFPAESIIEMGAYGIDGGISRNTEMLTTIKKIADMELDIRKFDGAIDISIQKAELAAEKKRLHAVDYTFPASIETLYELGDIYNCDFILGIGLDRAKQLTKHADRTVLTTVARGILDPKKWGTDRIYFILDMVAFHESSGDDIMAQIHESVERYGGSTIYINLEDYNVIDLKPKCVQAGYDVEISPNTFKHKTEIFAELFLAADNGYLKCPPMDIWFDEDDVVHYSTPPIGKQDIFREEMRVFESHDATGNKGSRGSIGWFGSPYKKATGRVSPGKPKDDTVYSLAFAVFASLRGDIPAMTLNAAFASAKINTDTIGDYR